jgi:hypothetical protein
MRRIFKKQLILSLILSYLALFINGLWKIRASDNIHSSASLILIICQIFILITLSYYGYHVLGAFKNPNKRMVMIAAAVIFIALWFYFLFDYILPPSYDFYVVVGRRLADNYGINWFWMDWGVWVQCITVYSFGVFLFLVNLVLTLFPNLSARRKQKKT